MTEHQRVTVLILGGGPAGLTAAIYAARAGQAPTVILGLQPGGQLTVTTEVENFPGFVEPVQGPWLMEQMQGQAERAGAALVHDVVTAVDFSARPFRAWCDSGTVYAADAVIIATGDQARWLGLESETRYRGFGVSACATCDGFFFRGKEVAVIGGGNTAIDEALHLAHLASRVTVIHRRDHLRGEKVMQERLLRHPKVSMLWNHVVEEIVGETAAPAAPGGFAPLAPTVTGLLVRDVITNAIRRLGVEGVFVAIGHAPATAVFGGQIEMDETGYLVTAPDSTMTSRPGVFAAGDVCDRVYRQAVTAAGMGCMAALDAERWLAGSP